MSKNKSVNEKNSNTINIITIIIIIFLIGALVLMFTKNNDGDNYIKEISYSEYKDIIKEDKYSIILLTNPDCVHCNSYKPFVNYAAEEYNLEVYDINLSTIAYEEYVELHDYYTATKENYNEKIPVIPTPVTIIVKNGGEVASILGDLGYNGLIKFLKSNQVIK